MSVNAWGAFANRYVRIYSDQVEYQHSPHWHYRAAQGVDGQPREGTP